MTNEHPRKKFNRLQVFFHATHITLGLVVLVMGIFGGLTENYPLLIPLICGMMIGFVIHHASLLVLSVTSLYIPTFETARETLSRYIAVLGLIVWLLLFVMDTHGRLLVHGYGLYIFANLFNATVKVIWDICLSHFEIDRRGST